MSAASMVIETERLRLLPFQADEGEALHRLFTDPGVRRYLLDDEVVSCGWVAAEIARSEANFRRHGFGLWTLRLHAYPEEPIGFCGYRHFFEPPQLQLVYGLAPPYWGRGLATEAACAVVRYGFEALGFDYIEAAADAPNTASFRVMEKAGLTFYKRTNHSGSETVFYRVEKAQFTSAPTPCQAR